MRKRPGVAPLFVLLTALAISPLLAQEQKKPFPLKGTLYLDWFGAFDAESEFSHRLSGRLKLEFLSPPGKGWTLRLDTRGRLAMFDELSSTSGLLYEASLSFDSPRSPWRLSLGQMNLYDTAGIGMLAGGMAGFKVLSGLTVGVYGGLESDIGLRSASTDYLKAGAFLRYTGSAGKSLSLSFNNVLFKSQTERRYVYAQALLPLARSIVVLFGNAEYEMGPHVSKEDRLVRTFVNIRLAPLEIFDLTAHYSSGRGVDFHRFLLEAAEDPLHAAAEAERFFYSEMYGLRLSLKPMKTVRLYADRRESRQKDLDISNHTWRFGLGATDILGTGLSFQGGYSLNRGTNAESDSFDLSLSGDVGRAVLTATVSNIYHEIRYPQGQGDGAELVRLTSSLSAGLNVFFAFSRAVAVSAEYQFVMQEPLDRHYVFLRWIIRL